MKALVVYDSVFGNTGKIAQVIGDALSATAQVEMLRVGDVTPERLTGLDLLVVGSPTRAFRPTPAMSAWLKSLPMGALQGVKVAAFDTRMPVEAVKTGGFLLRALVKLLGYAAEPMAASLKRLAGTQVAAPAGFFVQGKEGPLVEGELERAAAWASEMMA